MAGPNPGVEPLLCGQQMVQAIPIRIFPNGTGVPVCDSNEVAVTRTSAGVYSIAFKYRYPFILAATVGVELATPATVTPELTGIDNIKQDGNAGPGVRAVTLTLLNLAGSAADIAANAANSISIIVFAQANAKRVE